MKIVRVLSKRMPRRNIVRERNERGFHLFLQNLKGVVSLCASDEVFWTKDLIEETTQRLQDSYTTLTLIEHDTNSQMNDPLPEHVRRLKSNVQSLQRVLVSCESSASSTENSVSFLSSTKSKVGGSCTWKTGLEHNERINRIFAFYTFFMGKNSPVASHKCINASKKTNGVRKK